MIICHPYYSTWRSGSSPGWLSFKWWPRNLRCFHTEVMSCGTKDYRCHHARRREAGACEACFKIIVLSPLCIMDQNSVKSPSSQSLWLILCPHALEEGWGQICLTVQDYEGKMLHWHVAHEWEGSCENEIPYWWKSALENIWALGALNRVTVWTNKHVRPHLQKNTQRRNNTLDIHSYDSHINNECILAIGFPSTVVTNFNSLCWVFNLCMRVTHGL